MTNGNACLRPSSLRKRQVQGPTYAAGAEELQKQAERKRGSDALPALQQAAVWHQPAAGLELLCTLGHSLPVTVWATTAAEMLPAIELFAIL